MGKSFAVAALAAAMFGASAVAAQSAAAEDTWAVEVVQSTFGLFTSGPNGQPRFLPTREVPHTPGQGSFGWIMKIDTRRPVLRWREELTLPEKPATWGDAPADARRSFSEDGRTVILEKEAPTRPFLFQSWQVAPGDPKGPHRIRVTVEGAPPVTFDFQVR